MNRAEYQAWRRNNHPDGLTCEYDDQALYAKGLCWRHYTKLKRSGYVVGPPKPRSRRAATCAQCGNPRKASKGRPNDHLCQTCKMERQCVVCGGQFTATHPSEAFCSDECRPDNYWRWWADNNPDTYREGNQRARDKRRMRKTGTGRVERFWRKKIYERDGWKCGICRTAVDPELRYPDPMSASLDHIVPLSQGGDHTRANSRLAHWICNVARHTGNHDDPIQLTLVG